MNKICCKCSYKILVINVWRKSCKISISILYIFNWIPGILRGIILRSNACTCKCVLESLGESCNNFWENVWKNPGRFNKWILRVISEGIHRQFLEQVPCENTKQFQTKLNEKFLDESLEKYLKKSLVKFLEEFKKDFTSEFLKGISQWIPGGFFKEILWFISEALLRTNFGRNLDKFMEEYSMEEFLGKTM